MNPTKALYGLLLAGISPIVGDAFGFWWGLAVFSCGTFDCVYYGFTKTFFDKPSR